MKRIAATILLAVGSLGGPADAQVVLDPIDAMNNPSRHAWNLFLTVNHPAKDPYVDRGAPDLSKKIGDPGLTVWETWKLARTEVFLPDGSAPPAWEDMSKEQTIARGGIQRKIFDVPKFMVLRGIQAGRDPRQAIRPDNVFRLFGVDSPDGVFSLGGGETRMNRATFDFIVKHELYNIEGQEQYYEDVLAGKKPQLSFPIDSIEVKAMWTPLTEQEKAEGKDKRYHIGMDKDGKPYKLVALHIITKDVPKWFWTSFRHVDGPPPQIPSVDTVGRPSILNGTKWEFYELSGTQTDYTDAVGRPTYLSDPHIESGFEASSCISCHALSTIGRKRQNTQTPAQMAFFNVLGMPTGAPIGTPNPAYFLEPLIFREGPPPHQQYIQLDFLFSLSFRAQRKSPGSQ